MHGKQKARTMDGVMWKMSVSAVSLHVLRRDQQSLTLSSVEGEELHAGAGGWGHMQRQSKSKGNYISF